MSGPAPSLIRARHQIAVVGIVDALWIAFSLASLWFCTAAGFAPDRPLLLLLLVPHLIAAPWGLLLLCAPNAYNSLFIVLLGAATSLLSGAFFFLQISAVVRCFPGCSFCTFWFVFVGGGFLALALVWFVLALRYAAQATGEDRRAELAQGDDVDDDGGQGGAMQPMLAANSTGKYEATGVRRRTFRQF